jgi:hypothetical protein
MIDDRANWLEIKAMLSAASALLIIVLSAMSLPGWLFFPGAAVCAAVCAALRWWHEMIKAYDITARCDDLQRRLERLDS